MNDLERRTPSLVGEVVSGRYRVETLVAQGGMGAVYRAEHTHMRKRVALKVLHQELLNNEEAIARFEREAVAGAHIQHANVASATDFGKLEDGSHFLVLEYLDGSDLRAELLDGPLSPGVAAEVTRQVAQALRAAHALGIVHRDLKPENIMLLRREKGPGVSLHDISTTADAVRGRLKVKLLDFGIAKVPVDRLAGSVDGPPSQAITRAGTPYGTPEYMPPEQAMGGDVDGRSDLFALGVCLYEMLCGRRPFAAESRAALIEQVATRPAPPISGVSVPPALEAICQKLLAKAPDDRFQEAGALVAALDDVAAGRSPIPAPVEADVTLVALKGGSAPSADRPPGQEATPSDALPPVASRPAAPTSRGGALPVYAAGIGLSLLLGLIAATPFLRGPEHIEALERYATGGDGSPSRTDGDTKGTAPVSSATPDELHEAERRGVAGLAPLAKRFPDDPDVLRKLVVAQAQDLKKAADPEALDRLEELLKKDDTAAEDPDIQRFVLRAANGPTDIAKRALSLMAERMGSRGPDLLYRLMTAGGVGKFPKERAETLLASKEVRAKASPALQVVIDLKGASNVCARRPFLKKAAEVADERARSLIQPLTRQHKCGVFNLDRCYACGDSTAHLAGVALRAIDSRR